MKRFLLLFPVFFVSLFLFSQELIEVPGPETETTALTETETATETEEEAEAAEEETEEVPAEEKPSVLNPAYVLERDIATSSQEELADWCRSLGLDSDGSSEVLAERLREFYKMEKKAEETIETDSENVIIITIENAKTTEYFTVEAVHEDYVRLKGSVSVTIKDGEILHKVKADQILYNRTRKLITATGNVIYIKEEGDKIETFRGEGITVNLDTWSTAFMKGTSDHALTEGETQYRFSGEVISRSGENSTVLRHAEITNAAEEESLWSIKASKLWLLPGSDWAALSAVIKVGEVPVLWLPAFYYPANEIIFHPVLGIRSREGSFVQTTTYILGRPKAESSSEESSISGIMGSGEGMEKIREGVFLRSTGAKRRDETETWLSFMADAYTNLGFYLGSDLNIPSREPFGDISFSAGIGFSRDIAQDMGYFSPYFPDYNGTSNWHRGRFFNYSVPFRYLFNGAGSFNRSGDVVQNASVSWNFPLYSDPFVENDFLRRSENSELLSQIKNATTTDQTISETYISSYLWQLDGRLSFSTARFDPYINDLSITSAVMAVTFNSRTTNPAPSGQLSYPPDLFFFYPDKFTLFSVSASVGGMPLTLGERKYGEGEDASIAGWPGLKSPWDRTEESDNSRQFSDPGELYPPNLTRTISTSLLEGHRFTIDYRFTPSAASEIKFNSGYDITGWIRPDDIDWSDIEYQLFSLKADGNIGFTFSENRDIYTHSLRLYGSTSWQDYSYMNNSVPPGIHDNSMNQVRNMTYFNSEAQYGFTFRPFFQSEVWQTSNFQYSLRGLLASGRFINNEWTINAGKWDRENITIHSVQGNFNANVMDKMQSLTITADLPPQEATLAADATARIWISETNANTRVCRPFEDDPFYEPLFFTETLRFSDNIALRHHMVYDPDKSSLTLLNTSLVWGGLSASFSATRSFGYELVTKDEWDTNPAIQIQYPSGFGWYQDTEEKFNPYDFTLDYQKIITLNEGGRVSFNGSAKTGLRFDLQRYTNSTFYFTLGVGVSINRFLDITLSTHSENSVIFRYFQDTFIFGKTGIEVPGEKNPFIDLINSFRFDNTRKRQESGFKLKALGLDLVHHMGDWEARLNITLEPRLNQIKREIRFYQEISFVVKWIPIKEFKSSSKYNTDDGFSFD